MTVRELNGWTPSTVTFDASGDVVSVSVSEPRFTAHEKTLLLLSRRKDAEPRGSHGMLLSESTDPKNQYRYDVDQPTADFAALAINRAQDAYKRRWPDADMSSLLWRVELKD